MAHFQIWIKFSPYFQHLSSDLDEVWYICPKKLLSDMSFMKNEKVKVILYLAVQCIYNPTFHINCLIQIHIMLLSLFEFCKTCKGKAIFCLQTLMKSYLHVYCKAIQHFESKKHFGNVCVLGQSTLFAVNKHLYMNIQLLGYVYSSVQNFLVPACLSSSFLRGLHPWAYL
jgi:hypothetical protein